MSEIEVTYLDHCGSDLTTVNAARVSFKKESDWANLTEQDYSSEETKYLKESDKKLIHFLAKHQHISPFGHAFASFRVKAPIFVARQLVKHKFLRWNEVSRRYVDYEPEFYKPETWRGRSADKKQGSAGEVDYGTLAEYNTRCLIEYNLMLEFGVCPEQARMVLPQSTMTEWYWSGSLDAFAAMCKLRCAHDTQYESRIVANKIRDKMVELFPESFSALMQY